MTKPQDFVNNWLLHFVLQSSKSRDDLRCLVDIPKYSWRYLSGTTLGRTSSRQMPSDPNCRTFGHSAGFLAHPNPFFPFFPFYPFYPIVHSMCIPSYIPARTLELNSWTRRNCGNVRETQGRAVFFVKEKKHWMNCEMRKTCRIRLIRKLPAFVEDVSFVSVEVFEVFRSQQRVQISEGRLAA